MVGSSKETHFLYRSFDTRDGGASAWCRGTVRRADEVRFLGVMNRKGIEQ